MSPRAGPGSRRRPAGATRPGRCGSSASRRRARAASTSSSKDEGYRPERRSQYLIVGTETREDAESLAERLHGSVEPGGELVWETAPGNPFAVFGGLGL